MTFLRRLAAVLAWHATGEQPARAGEQAARIALYPTSRRQVKATPQMPPREGTKRR